MKVIIYFLGFYENSYLLYKTFMKFTFISQSNWKCTTLSESECNIVLIGGEVR